MVYQRGRLADESVKGVDDESRFSGKSGIIDVFLENVNKLIDSCLAGL